MYYSSLLPFNIGHLYILLASQRLVCLDLLFVNKNISCVKSFVFIALFLCKCACKESVWMLRSAHLCALQYCCEVRFLNGLNPENRY